MNEDRREIKLQLKPGDSSVVIDGVDVTKSVQRVILESDGTDTRLGVEVRAGADLGVEGLAVVDAMRPTDDPAGAILEFLHALDPDELDTLALENSDMETTPGAAFKSALIKLAEGL